MKKSTIWILGVVMGLSFISLLYLQISYIEEMVKMRNEQFDESVKRALMAASKDVESAEVDRWLREDISEAEKKAWEQSSQGKGVVQTQRFTVTSPDGTRYSAIELKTFTNEASELPRAMISRKHGTKTIPQTSRSLADAIKNRYLYQRALLDEVAYAVKKLDTNDFFVEPEIWDLLKEVQDDISAKGALILPEIHEHYSMPFKIARHGYFIYDFALPMVVLYSLYSGKSQRLASWLKKSPMKQFTTLDTHDGIGVVDARDILTPNEIEYTSNELYKVGANVKKKYSSAEYHNLDIYQINSTFYSALGDDDKKYFMARLLQVFAPGIPQVYYVGMLAGKNDIELLEKTKEGRNINRHYYSREEIHEEVQRPVVSSLINLLRFRNNEAAFDLNGSIEVTTPTENEIHIIRLNQDKTRKAELRANLETLAYKVLVNGREMAF